MTEPVTPQRHDDLTQRICEAIDAVSREREVTVFECLEALEEVRYGLTEAWLEHAPIIPGEKMRVTRAEFSAEMERISELHRRAQPLIRGALARRKLLLKDGQRLEDWVLQVCVDHPGLGYISRINEGALPMHLHGFEIVIVDKLHHGGTWAITNRKGE